MIDQRLDRVVRKRVDASDIVQDVLVEANRRLGDLSQQIQQCHFSYGFGIWRVTESLMLIDVIEWLASRSLDKEVSLDAPVDSDQSQTNLAQKIADTELDSGCCCDMA